MRYMSGGRAGSQHYLPAAYIGLFASPDGQAKRRSRERVIWAASRGVPAAYVTTPEARAKQEGIYHLPGPNQLGGHLDYWYYESALPAAISQLISPSNNLDALIWLETLVRFVAGLWVRGPDRNRGENTEGRVMEYQEVLAPIMAARWTVVHFSDAVPLITSDRGFGIAYFGARPAMVIPLSSSAALLLDDYPYTVLRRKNGGKWVAPIEHWFADTSEFDPGKINRTIAAQAIRDIYGSTQAAVESARTDEVVDPHSFGLPYLTIDTDLRGHFYDWYRMLAALRARPGDEQAALDDSGWDRLDLPDDAPIALELGYPERTLGGVYIVNDDLVMSMSFGQHLKMIRRTVGDLMNGAMVVMNVGHLKNAPVPFTLGRPWLPNKGASAPSAATLFNTETGQRVFCDLELVRADCYAQICTALAGRSRGAKIPS